MRTKTDFKSIAFVVFVSFLALWVGLETLHMQEDKINSFCENKTGIVETEWYDVTEINCDCWQNKPCQELPEGCCVYV